MLCRFDHDLWITEARDQRLSPCSHARNVAGDNRMTGRDGRTLEPSDDHFLQRVPLVVRVHWRSLPRWGRIRTDTARDHVHCMRPLRATTVVRPGGSNGSRTGRRAMSWPTTGTARMPSIKRI